MAAVIGKVMVIPCERARGYYQNLAPRVDGGVAARGRGGRC